MYEVKPYFEEDHTRYYGVYIKQIPEFLDYNIDENENSNLVVLCYSRAIAESIAELLEEDNELEEKDLWNR